ncbi:MAG: YggU family protein [Endomicrobiales bacterium]|nr:YggU family protein [Endomicrobiales bacterium]
MMIKVRVIPNAKRNEVVSRIGSILRVKVHAPAVEGKANDELCCFLAEFFEVRRSTVFLRKGERGREKTIEILGRSEEDLDEVLETIP